jgi:hypothetical protein
MSISRSGVAAGVLLIAHGVWAASPAPTQARERRLHLAAAEASSYLVNDWNKFQENYLPLYVGDDDPRTAWNLKTEGIGEWIRMKVTPMVGATKVRLKLRNGFQKTDKLFAANSRVRMMTVVLLPANKATDVELTDKSGWQEATVEQPAGPVEAVELRVKSVYPGKKYDDLCLSDVQLYVTATSSDNPAFEKQHFDKVIAWKKERADAAKLFQTALGKTLPIAPQYVAQLPGDVPQERWVDPCPKGDDACPVAYALGRALTAAGKGPHAAALRLGAELAKGRFAGMIAARPATRDKRPVPRADGLCTPTLDECLENPCENALPLPMTNQLGYLDADGLTLIEQTGLPTYAEVMDLKAPQCRRDQKTTFAWAKRDPAPAGGVGRVRALLLASCGMVEGREGSFAAAREQLLVYGDDGRLEVVADYSRAATLDWRNDADGPKLARAELTGLYRAADLTVTAAVAVAKQ